ncbi:MAG: hypothetical protein ABIJ86_04160, partial [Spirochaetota bacterium]
RPVPLPQGVAKCILPDAYDPTRPQPRASWLRQTIARLPEMLQETLILIGYCKNHAVLSKIHK